MVWALSWPKRKLYLMDYNERIKQLEEALKEAIIEYEYAYQYKGDFLAKKHGDAERVAELRKVLELKE